MLAIELGLTPAAFWSSTPREVALYARARARRARLQARRAPRQAAWHAAAFQRIERLPPLAEVLRPPRRNSAGEDLRRRAHEHDAIVARMSEARSK